MKERTCQRDTSKPGKASGKRITRGQERAQKGFPPHLHFIIYMFSCFLAVLDEKTRNVASLRK
jgi:hypothetical protein